MERRLYFIAWLFAVLFVISCEDLEDTYDEYAGDGMIRYIGKCSEVEVRPGWERLRVSWKNNLDAAIKRVKISWQSEEDSKPFVRYIDRQEFENNPSLMDTIYIEGLKDYVKIYLEGVTSPIVSLISMKSLEEMLPASFCRVHRSFIVNLNRITVIERNRIVFGKTYIPIADSSKDKFMEFLNKRTIK